MEKNRKRERAADCRVAVNESFSVDVSHVIVLLDTFSSSGFTALILTNMFSLFTFSFISFFPVHIKVLSIKSVCI